MTCGLFWGDKKNQVGCLPYFPSSPIHGLCASKLFTEENSINGSKDPTPPKKKLLSDIYSKSYHYSEMLLFNSCHSCALENLYQ